MLGLALLYATTSFTGEIYYALGWWGSPDSATAMINLQNAERIFPLEYRIRGALSYMLTAARPKEVPISVAVGELEKALSRNPYAADLHANLLKLQLEQGNKDAAREQLEILRKLVPNSALVQQLSAVRL